jgi:hypothetical protein
LGIGIAQIAALPETQSAAIGSCTMAATNAAGFAKAVANYRTNLIFK